MDDIITDIEDIITDIEDHVARGCAHLDVNDQFAENVAALVLGRKNGHYLHIGSAKQSKTRAARVEKMRPRTFKGIGFDERL